MSNVSGLTKSMMPFYTGKVHSRHGFVAPERYIAHTDLTLLQGHRVHIHFPHGTKLDEHTLEKHDVLGQINF